MAEPSPAVPVSQQGLMAPVAIMVGVAAVATFYLAAYVFPLILAGLAMGLGVAARTRTEQRKAASIAIGLGAAALVLSLVAFAIF